MINRILHKKAKELISKFPVLSVTGPRQSGKTTLIKNLGIDLPYVSLEDPDLRLQASNDPRGFLNNFPNGAILDEVQHVPELFSYIQTIVDNGNAKFILSGSQNFLLSEKISQSLAGRTAILKLLPLSLEEFESTSIHFSSYEEFIFKGAYPRIYDKNIDPVDFYTFYMNTYIERDVRLIKNIEDLSRFSRFIKLCAGRCGQLLNIDSLATDASISPNTAKSWLSVLEASYIIYFLHPHHKNFNKRLVKSPKLYFYDTGLACNLLGIESAEQVKTHYLKGALFENMIINEFVKKKWNAGKNLNYYFWQNKSKKEIDILIETATHLIPIEIKSGHTKNQSFLSNLKYWQRLSNEKSENLTVIYGGDDNFSTSSGNFVSWRKIHQKNFENIIS